MPLYRLSVGTYPETSSHATCQGTFSHSRLSSLSHIWTEPGLKSGISVCELISTSKKKEIAGGDSTVGHFPQILASGEKATRNGDGRQRENFKVTIFLKLITHGLA